MKFTTKEERRKARTLITRDIEERCEELIRWAKTGEYDELKIHEKHTSQWVVVTPDKVAFTNGAGGDIFTYAAGMQIIKMPDLPRRNTLVSVQSTLFNVRGLMKEEIEERAMKNSLKNRLSVQKTKQARIRFTSILAGVAGLLILGGLTVYNLGVKVTYSDNQLTISREVPETPWEAWVSDLAISRGVAQPEQNAENEPLFSIGDEKTKQTRRCLERGSIPSQLAGVCGLFILGGLTAYNLRRVRR